MNRFRITLSHRFFILILLLSALFSISTALESNAASLELEWRYGIYGTAIGKPGILIFDIDNDGILEIVTGSDNFWYIVKQDSSNTYAQTWISSQYATSVSRIALADVDADGISEIYVGLSNGTVKVYNGLTKEETTSFTTGSTTISALVVADVDGDGIQEIIVSDGSKIYVYSAESFTQEWVSTAYGGTSLAVGNVDMDLAPEIITTKNGGHGYVIDGISHILEWDYINNFGNLVELGDIDSDGMDEIIGAASGNKITAFDVDIKSPKWEIATSLDIGALHVADVNGDGIPEILYGDGQWGKIHCYDAITKIEKWSINNPEHGVTDIATGDINSDGILEIMWGAGASSSGPDYLYVADTVTHLIEWQNVHIDGPLSAVDVGDVDDDGQNEIVMVSFSSESGYESGVIHIFNASTHSLEWQSTLGNMDWMGVRSVKIGDVDDDGETEFVITTANIYDGVIQVYNGKTHILERQSAGYWGNYFTALAIGDVDNDGKTEIVAGQGKEHTGAAGVYLIVFDGATLMEKWKSVDLGSYWGKVYDIELADVDKDGNIEIIASLAGEKIYVFDGLTHQLDWLAAVPAYAMEVFDLDNDGENEILIGRNNGIVEVYNGLTFTLKNSYLLGNGNIIGLLVDDVNQSGGLEWLVSDDTGLSVFNGETKNIMWQSSNLGSFLGNFNHISSRDIDNDGNKEIVLGSSFALYQFEVLAGAYPDFDNDGYTSDVDCDDNDSTVNPGATEVCDGVDNNCNGEIDEGFDVDDDGYTTCNGDCDDNDPLVNPGMTEILYNGKDDDCNPTTPDVPLTTKPVPDIKANSLDGPLTIPRSDILRITISLAPGNYGGNPADWWVLAKTPMGWYYRNLSTNSWKPGQTVTKQGPLFAMSNYKLLNQSGLPVGTYEFYFGVDLNMNGLISYGTLYYDKVVVNVTP